MVVVLAAVHQLAVLVDCQLVVRQPVVRQPVVELAGPRGLVGPWRDQVHQVCGPSPAPAVVQQSAVLVPVAVLRFAVPVAVLRFAVPVAALRFVVPVAVLRFAVPVAVRRFAVPVAETDPAVGHWAHHPAGGSLAHFVGHLVRCFAGWFADCFDLNWMDLILQAFRRAARRLH